MLRGRRRAGGGGTGRGSSGDGIASERGVRTGVRPEPIAQLDRAIASAALDLRLTTGLSRSDACERAAQHGEGRARHRLSALVRVARQRCRRAHRHWATTIGRSEGALRYDLGLDADRHMLGLESHVIHSGRNVAARFFFVGDRFEQHRLAQGGRVADVEHALALRCRIGCEMHLEHFELRKLFGRDRDACAHASMSVCDTSTWTDESSTLCRARGGSSVNSPARALPRIACSPAPAQAQPSEGARSMTAGT